LGRLSSYYDDQHAWNCTGKFNQALLDPEKNPVGIKIKTAVVGFGRDFDTAVTDPSDDVKDAKSWESLEREDLTQA
jgi:type IV pilus assembly protein PilY1